MLNKGFQIEETGFFYCNLFIDVEVIIPWVIAVNDGRGRLKEIKNTLCKH